jgi:hypothetical protein
VSDLSAAGAAKSTPSEFPISERSRGVFIYKTVLAVVTCGFVAYQGLLSYLYGDAVFVFWLGAFFIVAAFLTWSISRVKVISVQDGVLRVRTKVAGRGFGTGRAYEIARMRNLRLEQHCYDADRTKNQGYFSAAHDIVFDYSGHNEVLVSQLSEERAQALLNGPLKGLTAK